MSPNVTGRLLVSDDDLAGVMRRARRIAVLGIKTDEARDQPAYGVPAYLLNVGYTVVPVPVYYPEAREILGQPVYRRVADVPAPVDIVQVFRRPADLPAHLDDLLAAKPAAVWLQLGIRDDAFTERLIGAGIDVVQDRCMKVEHVRLLQATT